MNTSSKPRIAVCIPCHNEEATVADVVRGFKEALPDAQVFVLDNASTDDTAARGLAAGAEVRHVSRKGKGNVVRWMFSNVDADVFVMADGDLTYDPSAAGKAIDLLLERGLDLINIARAPVAKDVSRAGHQLGNRLFQWVVRKLFGDTPGDMLSGYKVVTRRFAASFPSQSENFEIETELTIHMLSMKMPWIELEAPYYARPDGSESKLSTFKDGIRILKFIVRTFKNDKPLQFFSIVSALLFAAGLVLGIPVVIDYFHTHLVQRFPTAFLSASLMTMALLSFAIGLILDVINTARREFKQLSYLQASHCPPRAQG